MGSINLRVQGMTCGACVRRVTHGLSSVAGVDAINIDLTSGLVRVDGDANEAALLAALHGSGYPAQLAEQAKPVSTPAKGCGSACGCR